MSKTTYVPCRTSQDDPRGYGESKLWPDTAPDPDVIEKIPPARVRHFSPAPGDEMTRRLPGGVGAPGGHQKSTLESAHDPAVAFPPQSCSVLNSPKGGLA